MNVDILDHITLKVVDNCDGPTAGMCPLTAPDGTVACAGHRVAAVDADPQYWHLWVPPGSRQCPLAWALEAH